MKPNHRESLDPLGSRFLFGDAGADAVLHQFLMNDMRSAQLSQLFRVYYLLRSLIPLSIRQLLQRYRGIESSPRWFFPDELVESLGAYLGTNADGLLTIHPWPDAADFSFVLTHDVETAEGMGRVLQIAELEQALGFRSSWNIVPYKYPVDQGILRELTSRGFEIGVHGFNHDGRLFTSRAIFDRRVPAINAALDAFGAVGFRAPMVHRNLNWLQSLNIDYDASCFDVDCYQAMPGGVGGVWPFMAGRFVELPYTLPQDHTLFVALGHRDGNIWKQKLDYIKQLRGMALLITHPDYLDSPERLKAYRELLEHARQSTNMWHALPREVAEWWRMRDRSNLTRNARGDSKIEGPAAGRARMAMVQSDLELCKPSRMSENVGTQPEFAPSRYVRWDVLQLPKHDNLVHSQGSI